MSASNKKQKKNPLINMPSNYMQWFIEVLKVQASSSNEKMIYYYLRNYIEKLGIDTYTDEYGNLIATKGKADIYPCIVAHMDTVHDIHPTFDINTHIGKDGNTILDADNGKTQVGVGGDDKCGIFACLFMLEHIENIKVVFFSREEIGLIGSSGIDHDILKDVGYIIQLDRWGSSDFICMQHGGKTVSDEFLSVSENVMASYGYKEAVGLITDSINLFNDNIGVSCVNVSCGYYQHHSDKEYIDANELWNSLLFTKSLINSLGENEYIKEAYSREWNTKYGYGGGDSYFPDADDRYFGDDRYDVWEYIPDDADWDVIDSILKSRGILYTDKITDQDWEEIEDEYLLVTNNSLFY